MFNLKPCPFCGGKVKVTHFSGTNEHFINELHLKCENCNCEINLDGIDYDSSAYWDNTDVVAVWNTRSE